MMANTSTFFVMQKYVPRNATEFKRTLEHAGYIEAEFFDPEKHCGLNNLVKLAPSDLYISSIYLIGLVGVFAFTFYIHWKNRSRTVR
jgi:hypothetical protein